MATKSVTKRAEPQPDPEMQRFRRALIAAIIEDALDCNTFGESVMPEGTEHLLGEAIGSVSQEISDTRERFHLSDLHRVAVLLRD